MSTIFSASDGRDQLFVTGRHVKPVTDELMVTIHHAFQQHSVILSRSDVHVLYAALGIWLATGWPGVRKSSATTPDGSEHGNA